MYPSSPSRCSGRVMRPREPLAGRPEAAHGFVAIPRDVHAVDPDDSILFGATIRENIAYGNPDASMDEILAAARAANADEFVREMENGYDTVIGERGATLSGGQRQRIAIARAFVRDAPMLVLDEPMTGLDVENEARVREALDRLMAGRTCLMITHDLGAVADADLVLVLEEGCIIERGTHEEMAAGSQRYRQLYELDMQRAALEASS